MLVGLWAQIPSEEWISLFCECCMLSGRGLCVGLITRPEESYQVYYVSFRSCSLDYEGVLAHWELLRNGGNNIIINYSIIIVSYATKQQCTYNVTVSLVHATIVAV